jgi:DNA replication protein DnaC
MASEEIEQPKIILDKLMAYAEKPGGFLILVGKNGTGKSFAAYRLMSMQSFKPEYRDSDDRRMITQAELNLRWQNNFQEWGDCSYLLNIYKKCRFLVLDDIGTRVPSEAFMDFLYALIDHRCKNGKYYATIITTNLNSKDMRAKFGDAFVSRICSGDIIKFEGKDRRLKEW